MDNYNEEEKIEEPILMPMTNSFYNTQNNQNEQINNEIIEPAPINNEIAENNLSESNNNETIQMDNNELINVNSEISPIDNSTNINENNDEKTKKDKKKKKTIKFKEKKNEEIEENAKIIYIFPKKIFNLFTFVIIVILLALLTYSYLDNKKSLEELNYSCTPLNSYKEKTLDLNSTIVQNLYKKVRTTILEDYAQPEWDNTMKLYLAYRQLTESDFYESNCTLFKSEKMEPYKCTTGFTPKAFKVSSLILEWKKLFGEETPIELDNIKLKNACIGGYEYIRERDEFVEGYCDYNKLTSFKVTKTLKEATTTGNTITLKEYVKYHENEKMEKPSYLKSGTYIYTFKLDMNYNYVLVSKTLDDNY